MNQSGTETASQAEVREALIDFQRYLSDEIAPMMVLESVELLIRCPSELMANEIQGWIGGQSRGPQGFTVSDYIFHALKKIHLMSEFDLIESESLDRYLQQLSGIVIQCCPPGEREALQQNLAQLGRSEGGLAAQVEVIHSQVHRDGLPGEASAAAAPSNDPSASSAKISRDLNRFSLMLDRLSSSPASANGPAANPLLSQALTSAAVGARNQAELEQQLQRLTQLGYDANPGELFRSLSGTLPGWVLPLQDNAAGATALPESHQIEAMHRIISMAPDPREGANRFSEMVQAAIEQFNEGRLGQATRMFDLAERIVSEKQINAEVVASVRTRSHDALDSPRLREYAANPEKHAYLRKVLDFFDAFGPKEMLLALDGEPKREKRRLLLDLLEVQGAAGRESIVQILRERVADPDNDPKAHYRRNLVFLLRRISRDAAQKPDDELNLLIRCLDWGTPTMLLKEAIGAVGKIHCATSEQALITLLSGYEGLLCAGKVEPYGAENLLNLVDRAVSGLVRIGSDTALAAVIEHGLRRQTALGTPLARLEELAGTDLSPHKALVGRLVNALRAELPVKVLGFVVGKSDERIAMFIHALAGTPAATVRELLEEIVDRFSDRDFSHAAKKTLAALGATARSDESESESLAGDIELFGLPSLLQNLCDSRITGTLTLTDREGDSVGTIHLEEGRVLECAAGSLRGETAFFQLFEKPTPGNFNFKNRAKTVGGEADNEPFEVLPAILEALRRHDEFQQARALVPDDAAFRATEKKPTRPQDEQADPIMRGVWKLASTGGTPARCEMVLPADSYRIRRLYAHWLEQGALQPT